MSTQSDRRGFPTPAQQRDFDKESQTWDEEPRRVKLADDVTTAILKTVRLTRDMDVLDYGCGTGLLTLRLQPLVHTITGVDTSRGMIDVLMEKIKKHKLANIQTEFLDIEKGEQLKGRFHLITCAMTMHHIPDLERLFEQFYERLLPGGYLCMADIDSDGGKFHKDNTGVFHPGFDRLHLKSLLIQQGFHDVHDMTAATIDKSTPDEGSQIFTVFLMTAVVS